MVDNRNVHCLVIEDVSHIVLTCATFAKSGHTTPHHVNKVSCVAACGVPFSSLIL